MDICNITLNMKEMEGKLQAYEEINKKKTLIIKDFQKKHEVDIQKLVEENEYMKECFQDANHRKANLIIDLEN